MALAAWVVSYGRMEWDTVAQTVCGEPFEFAFFLKTSIKLQLWHCGIRSALFLSTWFWGTFVPKRGGAWRGIERTDWLIRWLRCFVRICPFPFRVKLSGIKTVFTVFYMCLMESIAFVFFRDFRWFFLVATWLANLNDRKRWAIREVSVTSWDVGPRGKSTHSY